MHALATCDGYKKPMRMDIVSIDEGLEGDEEEEDQTDDEDQVPQLLESEEAEEFSPEESEKHPERTYSQSSTKLHWLQVPR